MAQPTSTPQGAFDEWAGRARDFFNKPNVVTDPAPAHHQPWHNRMFGCFAPPELCCVTWCCPCVTFGKTHHRLRGDPTLKDYSAVNGSCLIWLASACVGIPCFIQLLQRHEIRTRFNLQGDGMTDCLRAWCCHCCDLIQQDKEVTYHLLEGGGQREMVTSEPEKAAGMAYQAPVAQPVVQDPNVPAATNPTY